MNAPVSGGVEHRVDVLGGPIDDRGADVVQVQPAVEGRAGEVAAGSLVIHGTPERKGVRVEQDKGAAMRGALEIIGLVSATLSAYFLWRGSEDAPWPAKSWGGNSPEEVAFRARRARMAKIGFLLLGAGFGLQLVARLF